MDALGLLPAFPLHGLSGRWFDLATVPPSKSAE